MLTMNDIHVVRLSVVNSLMPSANLILDPTLKPPGDMQAKLLRQIVLSGLGDHVARFVQKLSFFIKCKFCLLTDVN